MLGDFGFSVLLPLTALIIGTGVLGAEIDDGSVVHLLATPVRRADVIVTKFAVAVGLTALFAAVPELIAGLLAPNSGKLAFALFVGALVGSVVYCAVFLLASVLTTRAIAFGLLYVAIWEGLLSNLVGGVRILSIAHYSLGVANAIYPDKNLQAGLALSTSLVLATVITVGGLYLATRRLQTFALTGDARLNSPGHACATVRRATHHAARPAAQPRTTRRGSQLGNGRCALASAHDARTEPERGRGCGARARG